MWREPVTRIVTTLWVGSQWTIGYLVAPVLFGHLADRAQAGTLAGAMFQIEAWMSLLAPLLLWRLMFPRKWGRQQAVLLAMALCTVLGYFALQPSMAALRPLIATDAQAHARFGMLHGISSVCYGIQSVLGLALLWLQVRAKPALPA